MKNLEFIRNWSIISITPTRFHVYDLESPFVLLFSRSRFTWIIPADCEWCITQFRSMFLNDMVWKTILQHMLLLKPLMHFRILTNREGYMKRRKKKGQQYQIIRFANHFPCLNSIFKLKPAQRKQFKPIWYCYLRKEATIILTKIVKIWYVFSS